MPVKWNVYHIVAIQLILLAVMVYAIFVSVLWGSGRKKVVTCASFGSYGEAYQFVVNNPQYANSLDKNHNGKPCETAYGTL